ncbi:Uncharacterized protein Rs2_28788 [Raphanus sativus]|nr:Uncharacterized protein Rs2_28788 [Raphanus sativus]
MGCCTGLVGWRFGVTEDFYVLPSPILADLFQPHEFDQFVPDTHPKPIIISDDDTDSDVTVVPAPIIIISDDDTETDDVVTKIFCTRATDPYHYLVYWHYRRYIELLALPEIHRVMIPWRIKDFRHPLWR